MDSVTSINGADLQTSITRPKTNPWGIKAALPCSLEEVMSEQLAQTLQIEQESSLQKDSGSDPLFDFEDNPEERSDLALALALQFEYDKEHDQILAIKEQKLNGLSKVSVSYKNYHLLDPSLSVDKESNKTKSEKDEESFCKEIPIPVFHKSGIIRVGKHMLTKHDAVICGRKNARKFMNFPPGFETGDGAGFDMQLSNKVFNKLKVHCVQEEKRNRRLHEKKELSTAEQVLDTTTRLLLFKLENIGVLDSVGGVISTGKEACVLYARGGQNYEQPIPSECAVKAFKTTLNEFKNREMYIKEDYRFKDRFSKQNPRKIIKLWAEKEMHNLKRMRKAGILCPEVVILRKHVLIMSFIGFEQKPAPKLQEARLSPEQMKTAYIQCVQTMKTLFNTCNLIHADLSEYNILWHNGHIWLIDVSQSVEPTHPHGLEFLLRDCTNISQFFTKQNVPNVMTPRELFEEVSGIALKGEVDEVLYQVQAYEKDEQLFTNDRKSQKYSFNYLFDIASKRRPSDAARKRERTLSEGSTLKSFHSESDSEGEYSSEKCLARSVP